MNEVVKSDVMQNELAVADVKNQVAKVQELMGSLMQEGQHYGTIPGTDKPTLLKAGAEKLGFMFRLAPEFEIRRFDMAHGHREYEVECTLVHIPTDSVAAMGVGSCSTLEKKYRYRKAARTCPECGAEAIIKGKEQYGGGWLCWKKRDGCGAKFEEGDPAIENQEVGSIENEDIADQYNTVLKMAKKRAHIDAMITATAASDIFTQDMEDFSEPAEKKTEKAEPETVEGKVEDVPGDEVLEFLKTSKLSAAKKKKFREDYVTKDPSVKPQFAKFIMGEIAKADKTGKTAKDEKAEPELEEIF